MGPCQGLVQGWASDRVPLLLETERSSSSFFCRAPVLPGATVALGGHERSQVPEGDPVRLTSPRPTPPLDLLHDDDKSPRCSCLLELGILSEVKCRLTDIPLFMEVAEKNKGKKKKASQVASWANVWGPRQPRRVLSWVHNSVLALCTEFGGLLMLHTRVANS